MRFGGEFVESSILRGTQQHHSYTRRTSSRRNQEESFVFVPGFMDAKSVNAAIEAKSNGLVYAIDQGARGGFNHDLKLGDLDGYVAIDGWEEEMRIWFDETKGRRAFETECDLLSVIVSKASIRFKRRDVGGEREWRTKLQGGRGNFFGIVNIVDLVTASRGSDFPFSPLDFNEISEGETGFGWTMAFDVLHVASDSLNSILARNVEAKSGEGGKVGTVTVVEAESVYVEGLDCDEAAWFASMLPTQSKPPPDILPPSRPSTLSVSIGTSTFTSSVINVSLIKGRVSLFSSPPPPTPATCITNVAFYCVSFSELSTRLISPDEHVPASISLSDVRMRLESSRAVLMKMDETCTRLSVIIGGGGITAWREGTGFALKSLVDCMQRIASPVFHTAATTISSKTSMPTLLIFVTANDFNLSVANVQLSANVLHLAHLALPDTHGGAVFRKARDSTNANFEQLLSEIPREHDPHKPYTKIETALYASTSTPNGVFLSESPYCIIFSGSGLVHFVGYKLESTLDREMRRLILQTKVWVEREWLCFRGFDGDSSVGGGEGDGGVEHFLFGDDVESMRERKEDLLDKIIAMVKVYVRKNEELEKSWRVVLEKKEEQLRRTQTQLASTSSLLNTSYAGFLKRTPARNNGLSALAAKIGFYRLVQYQLLCFTTPSSGVVSFAVMLKGSTITCVSSSSPLMVIEACDGTVNNFVVDSNEALEEWAKQLEHIADVQRVTVLKKLEGKGKRSAQKIRSFAENNAIQDFPKTNGTLAQIPLPPPAPHSEIVRSLVALGACLREDDKKMALRYRIISSEFLSPQVRVDSTVCSGSRSYSSSHVDFQMAQLSSALDTITALKADAAASSVVFSNQLAMMEKKHNFIVEKVRKIMQNAIRPMVAILVYKIVILTRFLSRQVRGPLVDP